MSSCSREEHPGSEESQPNIIVILADDLGWSDLGCYGSEINTPNLDRLANTGMRFTQFYNTSKCFPSRAALLTGLYAQQVGYGTTFKNPIVNGITLGEALKLGGYRTLWSGKHHGNERPTDRGFDRYFGLRDGAANHFNPGLQREGEVKPAQKRVRTWYIDSTRYQPFTPPNKDFYSTDEYTRYALQWLEEYKDEKAPFFLYLAYTAPHDPLMAWPDDIKKYRGKYSAGYEVIRKNRFEKQKKIGLIGDNYQLPEATYESWDQLSEVQRDEEDLKMAVYAAMVDRMDQNIGKVLGKLSAMGQRENTLIIFLSDNGSSAEVVNLEGTGEIGTMGRWTSLGADWANVSNTPFRYYKNYSYEGGINTPMIVNWPVTIKTPGVVDDFYGHFIDIMPTLLEVAAITYPEEYKGEPILPPAGTSFANILHKREVRRDRPVFWEWGDGKAVRKDHWKAVSHNNQEWDLYNLEIDPTEANNLAEQRPEIVKELVRLFDNWQKKMNR
ncbi:sulfatase-like hydrolase/transferase [Fulvivirga sp. M361]|nr:sulfatase-like hydrolase/transferase [Fulvivirga sp. M361]